MQITIDLAGTSSEQNARGRGDMFTQSVAACLDAVGDASASVAVHGATPYISYADAVRKVADLEHRIGALERIK
jgi:hypothetical protein